MKKFIVTSFFFCLFVSSLFALDIEFVEPVDMGWSYDSVECVNDSCSVLIRYITTDNATSDVFQRFVIRISGTDGVNWSTLSFSAVSTGGDFAHPPDRSRFPWWVGWLPPYARIDWDELLMATEMSYEWWVDTLADTCWLLNIVPGPKIQPVSFVYDTLDVVSNCRRMPPYTGPLWLVTGDTISPGFGQIYYIDSFSPPLFGVSVYDTLGASWGLRTDLAVDYNGPAASCPYPPDRSTIEDMTPDIQIVILDTFFYDFYPYPDSSGGTILPTEPHCLCYADPCCTTSTGGWLWYPYCVPYMIHRARIDTTSVRLSVNSIEYTLDDPGMHWLHDSLLVLNTEEAGLTFERGETVRVCLEEATDRTSQGYGPNHLGRYRDWTHPDTPVPFCWEFYIAGTGIEEVAATPEGFGIKSIKPNPFNSRTEIKFELAKEAEVSITVYNVQGQKVESLMKEKALASGSHSVVWNANDKTPTGIYFIKLSAGAFEDVKKVILLK